MHVTIASRHMDLTDAIKDYVHEGLEKIDGHFEKVIDVDVILSTEKHRRIAEFNLHANGLRVNSKEVGDDLYACIDAAIAKLDRQVLKHKDRIMRHQPRTSRETRSIGHHVIDFAAPEKDSAAIDESKPKVNGHRVILRESIDLKPMNVDEAALQLELLDERFIAFTNADSELVNVLYKRGDGTFGLIEP